MISKKEKHQIVETIKDNYSTNQNLQKVSTLLM